MNRFSATMFLAFGAMLFGCEKKPEAPSSSGTSFPKAPVKPGAAEPETTTEAGPGNERAESPRSRLLQIDGAKLPFTIGKMTADDARAKLAAWQQVYAKMWQETSELLRMASSISALSTKDADRLGDVLSAGSDKQRRLAAFIDSVSSKVSGSGIVTDPKALVQAIATSGVWKSKLENGNVQVTLWNLKDGGITPEETREFVDRVYFDATSSDPRPRFKSSPPPKATPEYEWVAFEQEIAPCTLDTLAGTWENVPLLCVYKPSGGTFNICGGAHGIDAAVFLPNAAGRVTHVLFVSAYKGGGEAGAIAKGNVALKKAADRHSRER